MGTVQLDGVVFSRLNCELTIMGLHFYKSYLNGIANCHLGISSYKLKGIIR